MSVNSPEVTRSPEVATRLAAAAPLAAISWLAAAGYVRPSGEHIRALAAALVHGLRLPSPDWVQAPREQVQEAFERLRDEALVVREHATDTTGPTE